MCDLLSESLLHIIISEYRASFDDIEEMMLDTGTMSAHPMNDSPFARRALVAEDVDGELTGEGVAVLTDEHPRQTFQAYTPTATLTARFMAKYTPA